MLYFLEENPDAVFADFVAWYHPHSWLVSVPVGGGFRGLVGDEVFLRQGSVVFREKHVGKCMGNGNKFSFF